ncbi:hypothetical protein GCM10008922_05270 [Faecalicatena contorta]
MHHAVIMELLLTGPGALMQGIPANKVMGPDIRSPAIGDYN